MSEFEKKLLERIEKLERENRELTGIEENKIPTYQYSKIRDIDLRKLFDLEESLNKDIFKFWFDSDIVIENNISDFLEELIEKNNGLIKSYNEEDLKMKFIAPLLNKIDFKSLENQFRDFYEIVLSYETKDFIINGTSDFVVSKGLTYSKKPYFFIQEFKKGRKNTDPEPQLLAELISAVELNNWKTIKGAYIVGAIWNFVILERLEKHKYQYFVSRNFDSTRLSDLKDIFKNLLFVKEEIIEMVKTGV